MKSYGVNNQKIIEMKKFYISLVALFFVKSKMAQWTQQNSGMTNCLRSVFQDVTLMVRM